jgi:uncharacterized membrane protein
MIQTVWPYMAVMLIAAGLFPSLERRFRWRVFEVLPPIVWTYLFVTALAVAGVWTATAEIQATQRTITTHLLPSLLFLLMVTCDLRAILRLGPRVLLVFLIAMVSILLAIVLVYLVFRGALPADGWKMLAALSATWTGGSANLVAVKQSIGLADNALPSVLLADALCYSVWVAVLFSSAAFAPKFDRWSGAAQHARRLSAQGCEASAATTAYPQLAVNDTPKPDGAGVLLWLGIALVVEIAAGSVARGLPTGNFFTTTSWTVLLATIVGLIVARTPLARIPGPAPIASALLAVLVAVLGSQSNFDGIATAPLFILCGATTLLVHIALLALAARAFKLEMSLCGIASLAQIGGVASAPILAATYSTVLVPIAVLLAMLGLILGTGVGLFMAGVLSALAPAG